MLFNSHTFILFFAGVLFLYYLPLPWRVKKFNLLWASYLFYAAWNPPFVLLLWISTVVDWLVGRRLYHARRRAARVSFLLVSLGVNLGLLAFFKYGNFAMDSFVELVNAAGIGFQPARPDIVLPIGISFYTFRTLSYTIDIYRGKTQPWDSFLDYALYVTFFPQLLAGPIARAADFLPQCTTPRKATADEFEWGLSLFIVGLFEKAVVADGILAPLAGRVYDSTAMPDMLSAWTATLAFAGQIFCDFAGYSTCAIGVGMCLGFCVPDNFRFPYAAVGFSDFWRRWHVSLSTWLRDYLYIPLGGNRRGDLRIYVNLMLTMLIGGLWHGASWTFVFWGGLHGAYLTVERALKPRFVDSRWLARPGMQPWLGLATFALICFTWVFFRANTFDQAFSIAGSMLGLASSEAQRFVGKMNVLETVAVMTVMLVIHWRLRDSSRQAWAGKHRPSVRAVVLAAMLFAIATLPGEDRAFIYFQF